jgi:hypothetical protein
MSGCRHRACDAAQVAGAAGLIVQDNSVLGGTVIMGGSAPSVTIPCLSIARPDGDALRAMVAAAAAAVTASTAGGRGSGPDVWQQDLAQFSAQARAHARTHAHTHAHAHT